MKRLISLILFLMMVVIFIGCATTRSEQGSGTYDLRNSVGNSPFVGATSPGARDLTWFQMYGP